MSHLSKQGSCPKRAGNLKFSSLPIIFDALSQVRFARNMETAKFDRGLKEERNLDWGDSEFYDYKEVFEVNPATA